MLRPYGSVGSYADLTFYLTYVHCNFCIFLQSKAVLVLLSLGKFYKALDMLYRY